MKEKKKRYRTLLQRSWNGLSSGELKAISLETEKTITGSREWSEARTVLSYLSFNKEISLDNLVRAAIDGGKWIYVPLITGPGTMVFHKIKDLSNLRLNRWGIREPSPDTECFIPNPGERVLILTPGLGFSSDGRRMGRGGGYYDRFLSQKQEGMLTMGICWDGVLREDLPAGKQDRPVDLICCRNRILRP